MNTYINREAKMPGPRIKFPDPKERSENKPVVLCPAERVLALYNQDTGKNAKRISKNVREWFFKYAHQEGWDGVHFVPEVQSQHGAGCVMWKALVAIPKKIERTTLILIDSVEE